MTIDPIASAAVKALTSEAGKQAGASFVGKMGEMASRVGNMPVDKAIANRSAFAAYLQNACASISRAKTILYRQPASIESFFEPITVTVRRGRIGKERISYASTEHVNDVLKLGRRLIIAGHAGAGKSIVMRHLFIDAYRDGQLLPVYVELRDINHAPEEMTIIDLIYQSLREHGISFSKEDLVRNLDNQEFLFLLDGLDEVTDSRMDILRKGIESLGDEHPGVRIVMSSRMSEDDFRSWQDYVVAETVELNKGQAVSLIHRLDFDDSDGKEQFISELEDRLYEQHRSFASNPLLLTMMLLVFCDRAAIPDDLTEFYSQAFDTLFRWHDADKRGKFHRELKCGLPDEEFKRVFSNFCFVTFLSDEFTFSRDLLMERIDSAIQRICVRADKDAFFHDLLESVCMLQRDGLQYTFIHRSFQEYFAAMYTIKLDNDSKLREIVVGWLDRRSIFDVSSSVYMTTLPKLNKDRFNRHVVFETYRDLCDECCRKDNPQFAFLERLYVGVELVPIEEGEDDERNVHLGFECGTYSLCILHDMLRELCGVEDQREWNGYTENETTRRCKESIIDYLSSMPNNQATFDEISEAGLAETLIGYTDMGASRAFAAVEEFERHYAQQGGDSVFDHLDIL